MAAAAAAGIAGSKPKAASPTIGANSSGLKVSSSMHNLAPPDLALSRPVADVIRMRTSRRAYENRLLEPVVRARLEAFLQARHEGVFGNRIRIALHQVPPPDFLTLRQSGTYGVIKGARHYLIGAVERAANNMVDFGFCFERTILLCTDLGLGTCWLGGTLNRTVFGQQMGTQPSEIVPAVSPVGYASQRRTLRDLVIRFGARSHKRRPWPELFFQSSFASPLSKVSAGRHRQPLELLRLAPSASNQQPWRVVQSAAGDLHFFLHRTAMYRSKLLRSPEIDLQRVDLGIAMCHFSLAAQEEGLHGVWEYQTPDVGSLPPHTHYVVSWRGT